MEPAMDTKLADLSTSVAVLKNDVENLKQTVNSNHADLKQDLNELKQEFRDMKKPPNGNGNGHHYQSQHDMRRQSDKPDMVTFTMPKDFFQKLSRTVILLILAIVVAIAASLIGIPVKDILK